MYRRSRSAKEADQALPVYGGSGRRAGSAIVDLERFRRNVAPNRQIRSPSNHSRNVPSRASATSRLRLGVAARHEAQPLGVAQGLDYRHRQTNPLGKQKGGELAVAARPIWRGHLRLALVSCPVAMYNARSERTSMRFNMINPATGSKHGLGWSIRHASGQCCDRVCERYHHKRRVEWLAPQSRALSASIM
jgi:hypothetical protein